jgi:hypothetical protein
VSSNIADFENIGLVVVHGIGDQGRFDHLDAQVREIESALRARKGSRVTTVIQQYRSNAFESKQAVWHGDPSVVLYVDDGTTGKQLAVHVHEVWWADINEPYSLGKQVRFWCWVLAIWLYPSKPGTALPTHNSVQVPSRANGSETLRIIWVRIRLFGVAFVAVLAAASVGMLSFLAERILKLKPPKLLRIFVNYVAGVKLYNQKRRIGAGFPGEPKDFLDAIGEPPRVSVRRRMMETLLDAANHDYSRWYVLAHSLGSVIAFNGLMETAYAWPGYTSTRPFVRYPVGRHYPFEGPANPRWPIPPGETIPQRPVGMDADIVAYRSRIFATFHGLITFGSPLEKFATIWPARVPISKEPAFRPGTFWLNVYDPMDPISGVLRSFDGSPPDCCPAPANVGYSASSVLLLAHIRYLRGPHGNKTLGDGMAELLVTGNRGQIAESSGRRWFSTQSLRNRFRSTLAWYSWIAAVILLAVLGALVYPTAWNAVDSSVHKILGNMEQHTGLAHPEEVPKNNGMERK